VLTILSDREELKWTKKWAEMLQEGFLIGEKMHEKILCFARISLACREGTAHFGLQPP